MPPSRTSFDSPSVSLFFFPLLPYEPLPLSVSIPPRSFSDNSHINSRQIEIKTGSIEMQFTRMHNASAARRTEAEIVYLSRANHARAWFPPCDLLAVNCLLCICFWFSRAAIRENYRIRRFSSQPRSSFEETIHTIYVHRSCTRCVIFENFHVEKFILLDSRLKQHFK